MREMREWETGNEEGRVRENGRGKEGEGVWGERCGKGKERGTSGREG
jgi:hypothetical protein